eukprot:gene2035-1542_t
MKAKFFINQEIRRLSIDENTSFEQLKNIIEDFWLSQNPNDKQSLQTLSFRYLDTDEDWVRFSTAEEWKDALTNVKEVLKVKIEKESEMKPKHQPKVNEENVNQPKHQHNSQPQFPNFSQQGQQGNGMDFIQQFLTPENIQMAQNMFSQFTQGQNQNDFMNMFQQGQQNGQPANMFPFFQTPEQYQKQPEKKNLSDEEVKSLNEQLLGMGFIDSSMNESLLKKYEGNVEKVVNHLISL